MLRKILICLFVSAILSQPIFSQTKKKRSVKNKPIQAQVTVKTDLGKDSNEIDEKDSEIWNTFLSLPNHFEVSFPSKNENIFIDNPLENIFLYEAKTRNATYAIIVKPLDYKVLPSELERVYDELITGFFLQDEAKLISTGNVSVNNFAGREVVFENGNDKVFGQIYLVEDKLYIISVYMKKTKHTTELQNWINKFFSSFDLKYKRINES